jgi:fimbrial chaperone protein
MQVRRSLLRVVGTLGGIAYGCCSHAGALAVAPTRVELSSAHPVATMQVSNEGDRTVIIQLERMAWSQRDGEDVYTASTALVATPTVFELAPHAKQVVRVACRGESDGSEHAYRLYASEVEEPPSGGDSGVRMLVRIGVPVFAESRSTQSSIEGAVTRRNDGSVAVLLRNGGAHFKHALGLAVRDASGSIVWQAQGAAYLLASGEHRWVVDAAVAPLLNDRANRLALLTEAGPENIDWSHEP